MSLHFMIRFILDYTTSSRKMPNARLETEYIDKCSVYLTTVFFNFPSLGWRMSSLFLLVFRKYGATHRHYFILPFAIDKTFVAVYLLRLLLTYVNKTNKMHSFYIYIDIFYAVARRLELPAMAEFFPSPSLNRQ